MKFVFLNTNYLERYIKINTSVLQILVWIRKKNTHTSILREINNKFDLNAQASHNVIVYVVHVIRIK